MSMKWVIFGAGGTGRTVAGCLLSQGETDVKFLDDNLNGTEHLGIKVVGKVDDFSKLEDAISIIAFGSTFMKERKIIFNKLKQANIKTSTVICKSAYVDITAEVGPGTFIGSNCSIIAKAQIGENCIVCANASIDHDSVIKDNVYISPGVNLAGATYIEENTFVGTNASILPEIRIGKNCIVGAGAVVTKNVPDNTTVVGIPAAPIRVREDK